MKGSAQKFLNKAIGNNGNPKVINIDKSGANKEGIRTFNKRNFKEIRWRQCKYLNNIVEQDHWRVKRITRLMLGFKSFYTAQSALAGIELVAMLKKGQMKKKYGRFPVASRTILRFSCVGRKPLCCFL